MKDKQITHLEQVPQAISELMQMVSEIHDKVFGHQEIQAPMQPEVYLTRKEAAALLRISLVTLGEMSKRGDIKAYRLKNVRGIRYKKSEIAGAMCNIVTT